MIGLDHNSWANPMKPSPVCGFKLLLKMRLDHSKAERHTSIIQLEWE